MLKNKEKSNIETKTIKVTTGSKNSKIIHIDEISKVSVIIISIGSKADSQKSV